MTTTNPLNLIWIDLEMTGLNPLAERIIEIATVVTDSNLVVSHLPSLYVGTILLILYCPYISLF